jgi:hypothetical protein
LLSCDFAGGQLRARIEQSLRTKQRAYDIGLKGRYD